MVDKLCGALVLGTKCCAHSGGCGGRGGRSVRRAAPERFYGEEEVDARVVLFVIVSSESLCVTGDAAKPIWLQERGRRVCQGGRMGCWIIARGSTAGVLGTMAGRSGATAW